MPLKCFAAMVEDHLDGILSNCNRMGPLAWISTERNQPNIWVALFDEPQEPTTPPWDADRVAEEARGQHDREVGAAMEAYANFLVGDGDVSGHVDEVTGDLARLGIIVAAHAAGHEAIESGSEDQERYVKVNLETIGGGERIDVEEAHGIRQVVLDEHALGVSDDELLGRRTSVVGDENGRLLVAQIADEELAEGSILEAGLLFEDRGVRYFRLGTSRVMVRQLEGARDSTSFSRRGVRRRRVRKMMPASSSRSRAA